MMPTHRFAFLLQPLRNTNPIQPRHTALVCCLGLAASLLPLTGALAEETDMTEPAPMAELALHQQSEAPVTEIRLKLHSIEDLRIKPKESLPGPDAIPGTDTDELRKQAQTQYLAAKFKKREATVRKYVDLAWAEADKREKVEPELLIAIMQKESALRPKVQSRYGAQGLMQVVRRWHHDKLHPSESLFDPEVNIRVGADVLEEYLALAGGNLDNALRRYSGNARGYANTIMKESRALARVAEQAASRALIAQG